MSFVLSSTLNGHSGPILSLIQLKSENIVSASKDGTIKFWTGEEKCIKTLKGHSKGTTSVIQLKNGRVASSGFDKSIKIWYLDGTFQR